MNLGAIRTQTRYFLGVEAGDPAFPSAKLDAFINMWLDALYADYPPDVLVRNQTLTVDGGQERQYTFSTQSPAITDFKKMLEVRAESDGGVQLREKGLSEISSYPNPAYAITGADSAAVLTTNVSVKASVGIFARFGIWPAQLSADEDIPSSVPERFHHLAALGGAQLAFASGDEASFPAVYERQLFDGREQLLFHLARRSADVALRRSTEAQVR